MTKAVPKTSSSITSTVRDFGSVGASLIGGALGREVGSLLMVYLSPKVAKSEQYGNFAQYTAVLTLFDSLIDRFTGKEAI